MAPKLNDQQKVDDIESGIAIASAIDVLKAKKPNDRTPRDRHYQVALTDLEKVIAYFTYYVVKGGYASDQST